MQLLPPSCSIASNSTHRLYSFINTAVNAQQRYDFNEEVAIDRIAVPCGSDSDLQTPAFQGHFRAIVMPSILPTKRKMLPANHACIKNCPFGMSKACKKPVPYLWALPLTHRYFGKLKSSTACTTQSTRPIMEISQSLIHALQEAKTPEEAYKVFASTASQLMQDSMTKELADAIGRAKAATDGNPEIAGWEAYINGITLTGCWGTPGLFTSATDQNSFSTFRVNGNLLGNSISIAGSWSF